MSERINKNMCHLEFDPSVVDVKPSSPQEKTARDLLILHHASLDDLVRSTGLTPEQVLTEVKSLRSEYDIRGNKRIGYRLSPDPLKRVALRRHIEELSEARVVRR